MMLLDASLRISIVAVVAGLILMVMRVRASRVRHAVWTIVLMAMLLMPLLPSIVPTFEVAVPQTAVAVPFAMPALPEPSGGLISSTIAPLSLSASPAAPVRPGDPMPTRWPLSLIARAIYAIGV